MLLLVAENVNIAKKLAWLLVLPRVNLTTHAERVVQSYLPNLVLIAKTESTGNTKQIPNQSKRGRELS